MYYQYNDYYVYICMYVCIYVYICVCVCMYVCMSVCLWVAGSSLTTGEKCKNCHVNDSYICILLARVYSAFHPSGVGTMSRVEHSLQGDEPRTFIKGLKRSGTNQLGGTHIHTMHAGGRFGTSVTRLRGQVVKVNSAFYPSGVGTGREP